MQDALSLEGHWVTGDARDLFGPAHALIYRAVEYQNGHGVIRKVLAAGRHPVVTQVDVSRLLERNILDIDIWIGTLADAEFRLSARILQIIDIATFGANHDFEGTIETHRSNMYSAPIQTAAMATAQAIARP